MSLTKEEKIKKGFVNLKGKLYATMEVLLNAAHELYGDKFSIKTKLIEYDKESKFALFLAQVTIDNKENKQVFTGYGDSDKTNTGAMVQSAYIRMAETRAVCRALRFATNIADTSVEEMPKD